ncbi:MAG: sirohydrochlorin chelatase [Opitutaceae bacterium]
MNNSLTVFLVDNGSLRPQATFALRELAANLTDLVGLRVEAVSLLHSHKIDPADLGGTPATIVRRRLKECVEEGNRHFVMLPLFLGPSSAIKDYLPELIEEARVQSPDLMVRVADPLAGTDVDQPDPRLAEMLADHVRATMVTHHLDLPSVALVDHGTPVESVNRVRNAVAGQLAEMLGPEVSQVIASSMERRDAPEYDFNEPLLERLDSGGSGGTCIAAMFFLLPGRHAGEGGDVVEICDGLVARGVFEAVYRTPLLSDHPLLLDILRDRLANARVSFV